ncbi:hypothetical protein DRO30_01145 [Candidatus Bathyarchaeota archaeon]|nr:MAG: hypothetical protein DRO30_01145 [Candidatus Bathyarchaeota archaeon]
MQSEVDFRSEAVRIAAYLMSISARTAPKSKGEDYIEILYLEEDEKNKIAEKMIELGKERGKGFIRDGESLKKASGLLLIGVNGGKPLGLNCGACGFDCKKMEEIKRTSKDYTGPNCIFRILDLGIAVGSAVKLASVFNVDNRIIYRIGVVARMLGYTKADVVLGIPLASLGKNPFFDRK